jgi:prophage DNA circulation protein
MSCAYPAGDGSLQKNQLLKALTSTGVGHPVHPVWPKLGRDRILSAESDGDSAAAHGRFTA